MKIWRRFFIHKPNLTINSYTELYQEIMKNARQDYLWVSLLFIMVYLTWYAIYYIWIIPKSVTPLTFIDMASGVLKLLLVFLIFFVTISITQNPRRAIPAIIVNMLIFSPRPYQNDLGLDYDDIQQLKRIGEIEQNSADWRGSYINYVIIFILAALIANPQLLWEYIIFPLYKMYINDGSSTSIPVTNFPNSSNIERLLGLILIIFSILWILYKWVAYFREFISSEFANRAVLLACEELMALYRIRNISQTQRLSFRERRALMELFDYHLIAHDKANISHKNWAIRDLGENGLWHLIPPKKFNIDARISNFYTHLRVRMKSKTKPK